VNEATQIKTAVWIIRIVGALALIHTFALLCHAATQPPNSPWQDPPGHSTQCYWCVEANEGDCIVSQSLQLEKSKPGQLHIIERYPVAYSQQTGVQYNGHLTLMVLVKGDTAQVIEDSTWRREDGFVIKFHRIYVQQPDGTLSVISQQSVCGQ